jgi:hypothetical protein
VVVRAHLSHETDVWWGLLPVITSLYFESTYVFLWFDLAYESGWVGVEGMLRVRWGQGALMSACGGCFC